MLGLGEKRIRLLAAAAATNRLVIEERTTTQIRNNQKEGALQPLVEQDAVDVLEQDAVDVLHCGSTPKKRSQHRDESAVLIIVLHASSVLVTVRASKKKPKLIQTGKSLWPFSGIRESLSLAR